jgi:hypothetical protein
MWKIGWAPNNASKWQMGFNSAFKGLSHHFLLLAKFKILSTLVTLMICTICLNITIELAFQLTTNVLITL